LKYELTTGDRVFPRNYTFLPQCNKFFVVETEDSFRMPSKPTVIEERKGCSQSQLYRRRPLAISIIIFEPTENCDFLNRYGLARRKLYTRHLRIFKERGEILIDI